jgi:hypothetical protein
MPIQLKRYEYIMVGGLTESLDFPDGSTITVVADSESAAVAAVDAYLGTTGILSGRVPATVQSLTEASGPSVNVIPGVSQSALAAYKAKQTA